MRLPENLWQDMRNSKAVESITELGPYYLSQAFRKEENYHILSEFFANVGDQNNDTLTAMELLLETMVSGARDGPDGLNYLCGCRILPKFDGSLGLLDLPSNADVKWKIVANDSERDLFGFAAGSFVNTDIFQRAVKASTPLTIWLGQNTRALRNPITDLQSYSLDVRPLQLKDVGSLLSSSGSPLCQADNQLRDAWIADLWKYLNNTIHATYDGVSSGEKSSLIQDMLSSGNLLSQPIYRFRSGAQWQYLPRSSLILHHAL